MDYPSPLDGLTRPQRVKRLYDDAVSSLAETHRMMREERAFVWKLEQYENDNGNTKDRTRIQPRSRSLFRQIFYKAAQILKSPPYFKARPVDPIPESDAQTASFAKWALEHDLGDPKKRYDTVRRKTVLAGLSSRVGSYHLTWNPDSGPYGDIEVYDVDGTSIAWEPPYTDPHDPRCGWFMHWSEMPLETIQRQRGWKNTNKIVPDNAAPDRATVPDQSRPYSTVTREREPMRTQQTATVVMLWEKFGDKGDMPTDVPLPESDRYMVATTGPMAGQRVDYEHPDGGPLPELDMLEDGTVLKRVDRVATDASRVGYPTGNLTIVAVHSQGDPAELYYGPWPQKMRFFPYVVWQPFESPFDQISTSDVEQGWTMELVKNGTVRTWYEQIRASRGVMLLPSRGLDDYTGEPFTYTDASGVQAFYTGAAPPEVSYVPGPQPNAQIPTFLSYVGQEIRSNEGSGDISLSGSPDQLKGVAVGAIQQAAATGSSSVDDHIASFQVAEAVGLTVWHDIQRARWTQERWVRYLGPQGQDAYQRMQGLDIPSCDILITTRPTLDQLNKDAIDGAMALANVAATNPALAAIIARRANMDPDDVAQIMKAATPPMPPSGMTGAMPPNGPPPGFSGAPGLMTGPVQ